MKKNALEHIIRATLKQMVTEQAEAQADGQESAIETDNAPSSAVDSPFTPAEERFLGKFDAFGSTHLGIIYSPSITGIREFVARSGKDLNVTPGILLSLLRKKIIKLVPYTGFGRNDDYTIELQLSLDDVKGLGSADKEKAEKGSTASGAPAGGGMDMGAAAGPPPENAGYIPSGTLLEEAAGSITPASAAEISIASKFWSKVSAAMDGWNWEEDDIYNAFKTIKTQRQAIVTDALGRIFYEFTTGSDSKIIKVVKEITNVKPNIPKYAGNYLYTIERLLNNSGFKTDVVLDQAFYTADTGPDNKFINHLNFSGICKILIHKQLDFNENPDYSVYMTYGKDVIWKMRNQIIKQVTGTDVSKQQDLAAKAKPYKAKIENNRANYASKTMPTVKLETIKNINGTKVTYKGMWIHELNGGEIPYAWYVKQSDSSAKYKLYHLVTGDVILSPESKKETPFEFGTNQKGEVQIRTK